MIFVFTVIKPTPVPLTTMGSEEEEFKTIFLNKAIWILIENLLTIMAQGPISDMAAMVLVMAGH